jgi:antitoxin MazE
VPSALFSIFFELALIELLSNYTLYNPKIEVIWMEIQLRKWGNSIGFQIPHVIAERFGINENSVLELTESAGALVITKKKKLPTLDELLNSIPEDFKYPNDVLDFVESDPLGREII